MEQSLATPEREREREREKERESERETEVLALGRSTYCSKSPPLSVSQHTPYLHSPSDTRTGTFT